MERKLFACDFCDFSTNWKYNLSRHQKSAHPKNRNRFSCEKCEKVYSSFINLKRHISNFHKKDKCDKCNTICYSTREFSHHIKSHLNPTFFCNSCRVIFNSNEQLSLHKKSRLCGQLGRGSNVDFDGNLRLRFDNSFKLAGKAFKNFVKLYTLIPERKFKDPKQLILYYQSDFYELFSKLLTTDYNVKVQLCFQILFEKNLELNEDGESSFKTIENIAYFCPFPSILNHVDNIDNTLSTQILEVENKIDRFVNQGSFWNVNRIIKIDIRVGRYISRYGCYDKKLPSILNNKKALLNIRTFDNKCFLWSIIAYTFPVDNSNYRQQCNVSNYLKYENYFNTNDLEFPVTLEMIPKFAKRNNLSINIYGFRYVEESKTFEIVPIQISKSYDNNINLLLHEDHFYLIKNFNRFCANENSLHHFCYFCLQSLKSEQKLIQHMSNCKELKPQRVKLPDKEDNILRFKAFNQQIKFPFVIYADFETLTSKVNIKSTSKTKIFQNHIVCSYGYIIIDSNKDIVFSEFYRGEDANEKFLYSIKRESEKLVYYLYHIKKLKMTKADIISFKAAKHCSLCGQEFKRFERKNRDHGKTI
jgi:hypothetical protein